MTEFRDALPCAIEGWVKVPGGAYARAHEPARSFQYRVVAGTQDRPAEPIAGIEESADPNREIGPRGIPMRDQQLTLI